MNEDDSSQQNPSSQQSSAENSERAAIALNYDGVNAPKVTATGLGEIAEEIIAIAREFEVPLFENKELAGLLSKLELGEEIPTTLYLCIAQIIAFAYKIQGKVPEGWQADS